MNNSMHCMNDETLDRVEETGKDFVVNIVEKLSHCSHCSIMNSYVI